MKDRPCLKCNKDFTPLSLTNRICPLCNKHNKKIIQLTPETDPEWRSISCYHEEEKLKTPRHSQRRD